MKLTTKILNDFAIFEKSKLTIDKDINEIKDNKYQILFNNYTQKELNQFLKIEYVLNQMPINLLMLFVVSSVCLSTSNLCLIGTPIEAWNTLNLKVLISLEIVGFLSLFGLIKLLIKNKWIKKKLKEIYLYL